MNTFTRNLKAVVLFILLVFITAQRANSQTFNTNLALRLQHTLDSLQGLFPTTKGMSIGVYYPGQGSWRGASGFSAVGTPTNPNMEFGLASNTKLFTAVAIMKLVESNTIHLEDHLSQWLPTYTNVDPTITVRQLLNHTSGVGDVFTQAQLPTIEADPTKIYTIPEVMTFVGPKTFNPGANYGYSNTNYILAGMVAESATGQHISKLIRDNILTPLQLDSTFFDVKEPVLGSISHPWRQGVDFSGSSRNAINSFGGAAGAMYSTSSEMVQWYNALFNGNVLTPASLAQLTNFLLPGNYGFGLQKYFLFGRTFWGHAGVLPDYRSQVFYDPILKASVAGLSNSTPSAIDGVTALMMKVLIDNLPAAAGVVAGNASVCQGQNSVTYTIPAISKATSYTWTLPSGATGSSSTNSIVVNFGVGAISGNITVAGTNSFGNGPSTTLAVTVNPSPVITSINPNPAAVGGNVVINGMNMNTISSVKFNGVAATVIPFSATQMYSTVPVGGSSGNVVITNNLGCSGSFSFQINPVCATPVITSPTGTYPNPLTVSISCATPGASIYYTTTGNTPVIGTGYTKLYTGAFQLIQSGTIRAIGVSAGFINSSTAVSFITITNPGIVASPTMSHVTGTYSGAQNVSISTSTAGASIYYTTNGNTPVLDPANSFTKLYSGPFQINGTCTIKAIGVKAGLVNSSLSIVILNINNPTPTVSKPVISPSTGLYLGAQVVSINCSTPGATIYYTTSGNTPVIGTYFTKVYTSSFLVSSSATVRAMATAPGALGSAVEVSYISIGGARPRVTPNAKDVEIGKIEGLDIRVFPNPCSDILHIQFNKSTEKANIQVFNMIGTLMLTQEIQSTENETVSIRELPAGLYSVKVSTKDFSKEVRIVKQ